MIMQVNHGLVLINAWWCAEQHPRSFKRPDEYKLFSLKPNDLVKVASDYERFWVRVTAVEGDEIVGKINNHLVGASDLYGKQIKFSKDMVFDIYWQSLASR